MKNKKLTVGDCDRIIGENKYHSKELKTVEFSKKSKIQTIGKSAFQNNALESITIPNSVTTMGPAAFKNNEQLSSVTLSTSLESIPDEAFYVGNLSSVVIPSSVTSIGYSAFSDNQLTSVTIPSSVTTIGKFAFSANSNLKKVTLSKNLYDSIKIGNINDYFGSQVTVYCDLSDNKLAGTGTC